MSSWAPVLPALAWIWTALSLPILAAGLAKWDPLERLGGSARGPRMASRQAWFWMELPGLLVFPLVYIAGPNHDTFCNIVVALWGAHYAHRTFVWPWTVLRHDRTVPLALCLSGLSFNVVNGLLLGWFTAWIANYPPGWLLDPRSLVGGALMLAGAALNVWSDYHLARARRAASGAYVIPWGGAFKYLSCPNLLGEIMEWTGLAVLTWCIPALGFALWTAANLIPRALWRHQWYRETFPDYPVSRRAIFPRVL